MPPGPAQSLYGLPGSQVNGCQVVIWYFQLIPYAHPEISLVARVAAAVA
jgi:hypothetical protein